MINPSKSDVLVDLCTQRDYLLAGGARRVSNAEQILPNLKKLMVWARWLKMPVLSSVDVRRREESIGLDSPTCVLGTWGQQKLPYTIMPDRTEVESDNCLCVQLDILQQRQQAILIKRHRDPLTNPKLDRLLTEMPAKRFVVFGVALDTSIRPLILGMLLRGRSVSIVTDACGYWSQADADFCLRQLDAKGCKLTTTAAYIQESRPGRIYLSHSRRSRRSVA